jgi:hypothetical protein
MDSPVLGRTVHDLGTRAAPSLRTSGRSALGAQTVRNAAKGRLLRSRPRSRLPGGTPLVRRNHRVCLEIDKPLKTPLIDVEPKRDENSR